MTYENALAALNTQPTVGRGSQTEAEGLKRFQELFADLSEARIQAQIADVYAPGIVFNDTLKTVVGLEALREYLLESARAVHECRVVVKDVAESAGNYYVRWEMTIRFKKLRKGEPCRSIGISHLRLDAGGRVVLHQDFWDGAGGLFEHVPVLGGMIRWIKGRL